MFEWGIGLRPHHFKEWLQQEALPLFEILSDNYIYQKGGPALDCLDQLVVHRPPLLHGIGLNIGGSDPVDRTYLKRLKQLQQRTRANVISDHLCFCRGLGIETFDLLPIPYTQSELIRLQQRVNEVQDYLGQPISLENISAYIRFSDSSMSEMEFLMELCHRTGCRILLDVNNLFVSSTNLGWDAREQLSIIEVGQVSTMHISGYSHRGQCLYDSHDQPVSRPVLDLLQLALEFGIHTPVILERDDSELDYAELMSEWERIQGVINPVSPSLLQRRASLARSFQSQGMAAIDSQETLQSVFLSKLMTDLQLRPWSEHDLDLEPKSPDYWMVYVNGIIGRWTSLVDATVRRAAEVWGKAALAELLWEFAVRFPPREPDMTQAFRQLPRFVRDHPDFGRVSGLADLLESCFLYWELMEGEDPRGELSQQAQNVQTARLRQPAILQKPWQAGLNLYGLWSESASRSEAGAPMDWKPLNEDEKALLLVKTSASNVQALPIEPEVYPMIEALVQGHGLADAVAALAEKVEEAEEDRLEYHLSETLKMLQRAGLLREFA
jgi:uncharacterized protein (UPF0276 family)